MTTAEPVLPPIAEQLQQGRHHDPFAWLGLHPADAGWVVRAFLPTAVEARLEGFGAMTAIGESGLYEYRLSETEKQALPAHYRLCWREAGESADAADTLPHAVISPYSFAPQLSDFDLDLFAAGRHLHVYRILGAWPKRIDGIDGCLFAVWAPGVERVSVVGDFNGWHGLRHPMRNRGRSGVWELFIPGLREGDSYKYEIRARNGDVFLKTDPYARRMGLRPDTVSFVENGGSHAWRDEAWLTARAGWSWRHAPVSIYELHAGSWRRHPDGRFYSYAELAETLIPYVRELGYTHIELLPLAEHPLDESWGYQVSGYYAPTARYGRPDELRAFIDQCHRQGIGVLLDWVPAHFPRDAFALARFTGEPLYEYAEPEKGEHQDWGTLIFNYGRNEVRNFLIANAVYWFEEFHIDGLRVDAVASMLYLDYSREHGQWMPNIHGGREHLEAIDFLRQLNTVIHQRYPGVLTIAEESTDWPMVSRPVDAGGLGFSMQWNMGWMHDSLQYMQADPVHRRFHHNRLTFSQLYAYSENFVLPLSHDEVVHMKRSLLDKMPGDPWQKFANLRLLHAWHYAHPGKKLLFMGGEFGQWTEWNEAQELDWALLDFAPHRGLSKLITDLNRHYRRCPALHRHDFDAEGFRWVSCDDEQQSVLAFLRRGGGREILCVFNFTPVVRHAYRLGAPRGGFWRELMNTDAECYGGGNVGNGGGVYSEARGEHGHSHSIALTLPPLAALWLTHEHES